MNALYVKYSYTLEISSFFLHSGRHGDGLTLDFDRPELKFLQVLLLSLCVCMCASYFTSVESNFTINKMSKIILFLKRLYKNEIKLNISTDYLV